MPRAIWEGHITFGLVAIPVRLMAAEDTDTRLAFHQIDKNTMSPVHVQRVNDSGQEVLWEDIVKGYELEDSTYVTVTPEDFERANVEATRTIDIVQTACSDEVAPQYFAKPYYLAPAGKGGVKPYALLRETLRRQKRAAVASIVIRTREHLALVYPSGDALVLAVLRWPYELRSTATLDLPGPIDELKVSEKELQLADQLVEQLSAPWDPEKYRDTYREDLLALIQEKRDAGDTWSPDPLPPRKEPGEVIDLMSALKKSLGQAG